MIKTRPDNKFFNNFNLKNCDINRIIFILNNTNIITKSEEYRQIQGHLNYAYI